MFVNIWYTIVIILAQTHPICSDVKSKSLNIKTSKQDSQAIIYSVKLHMQILYSCGVQTTQLTI